MRKATVDALTEINEELELRNTELAEAKEAAEAASRTKSEFLANMSHEIRTPMNAILGFTEVLDGLVSDAQQREYLSSISTSGKSLLTLINDILDLSKVEAGKLGLSYRAINPKSVFLEMGQVFSRNVEEKGLDFQIHIDPSLPEALILDEIRLRQILFNLVGNAVKFTDSGAIRLSVEKQNTNYEGSTLSLVFSVADTGIGFSEAHREMIFDAFGQLRSINQEDRGGTGLGLAITKRLVEMMDGEISVRSQVGQGSTFQVILYNVAIGALAQTQDEDESFDLSSVTFWHAKILLVDDVDTNRSLVRSFLERYEFEFIEAANGTDAWSCVQEQIPDLVLLDMKMPSMSGYEVAKKLKADARFSQIPIIALTATAMKESEEDIRALCNGYLRKPISRIQLVQELMRFLPYQTSDVDVVDVEFTDFEAQIDDAESFIAALENKQADWEAVLGEVLVVDEIEAFAKSIKDIGQDHTYQPLIDWAEELERQIQLFDLDAVRKTLAVFPRFIENFRR